MSQFSKPEFSTHDDPSGSQTVTVSFKDGAGYPNVHVTFKDQPSPNDTNAVERTRWAAKAKELLTQAASRC
jgi:hypothetical protein